MFGVATRMDFGAVTTDCIDRRLSAHHCAGADNSRSNDDAKCHQDSLEGLTESIPAFLIIIGIPLSYSIAMAWRLALSAILSSKHSAAAAAKLAG